MIVVMVIMSDCLGTDIGMIIRTCNGVYLGTGSLLGKMEKKLGGGGWAAAIATSN